MTTLEQIFADMGITDEGRAALRKVGAPNLGALLVQVAEAPTPDMPCEAARICRMMRNVGSAEVEKIAWQLGYQAGILSACIIIKEHIDALIIE